MAEPSAAAATVTSAHSATRGIWVMMSSGQNLLGAMEAEAVANPAYSAQAESMLARWESQVGSGHGFTYPTVGDTATEATMGSLRAASLAVHSSRSAANPSIRANDPGASHTVTPATTAAPSTVNGNNPNSFAVRGSPGSGDSFWQNMPLEVDADYSLVPAY